MLRRAGSDFVEMANQIPRPVKVVAIVGGTHGNETNGVALARHLIRHPELCKRASFETKVLLNNLAAIEKNVRYVEEDINRCFFAKDLADKNLTTLEAKRAKEVNQILGPKGSASPKVDLILDLHNTTANTGVALMMAPKDQLSHAIGHHLMGHDSSVRIVNWTAGRADYPMCPSVAPHGMTFEVGGVPCGCLDGGLYQQSLRLLMRALDYVQAHNEAIAAGDIASWHTASVPVYESVRTVDYPRYDDGTLSAMVHPHIQGKDFIPLHKGDPIFLTMGADAPLGFETTEAEEASGEACYPFLVNEAAYYEKGIAFVRGQPQHQALPPLFRLRVACLSILFSLPVPDASRATAPSPDVR